MISSEALCFSIVVNNALNEELASYNRVHESNTFTSSLQSITANNNN